MPAILGDVPTFDTLVNIVRPRFPDLSELETDFRSALESGMVTNNSRFVVEFEKLLSEYLGVKYCLAFCNGETALICMLKAAELDGEVVVPSYTFSGTVHAVVWNNLKPVFADIDSETFNIDPLSVEEQIGPATSAILAVPLYGNPCENEALRSIAEKRGIKLLFDSAAGFGSRYQGVQLGGFGSAEIFSFHATKVFSTMEGGLLTTNDPDLYERARQLRSFGQIGPVDCGVAGLNGKMMEIAAIVGIHFLRNLDSVVAHRLRMATEYTRLLSQIPGLRLQKVQPGNLATRLYLAILVDTDIFGLDRDQLIEALRFENVIGRKFNDPPVHRMTCYRDMTGDINLNITDFVATNTVALPLFSDMTLEEVQKICTAISDIYDYRTEIHQRLQNGK